MLALLLGASTFPNAPKLAEGRAFYISAADVKEYLCEDRGLALPRRNILSLFDDSRSPSDQLVEVAGFLTRRTLELKNEGKRVGDLLIYYVGHGLFTRGDQAYCLAVRSTNEINQGATSIRAGDLAGVIKDNAAFLRRYLILDCCFAASIHKEFQSGALAAARVQIANEFPERGTAILCSSNAHEPSLVPQGLDRTMFSNALILALREGHEVGGPRLSFCELGELVKENLRNAYPESWVRPEVHSPDQREGDIAHIPLFPNPAYRKREAAEQKAREAQERYGRADAERAAQTMRAEQERVAWEKAEGERIAKEKAQAERVAADWAVAKKGPEQERTAKKKAEQEHEAQKIFKQERLSRGKNQPRSIAVQVATAERVTETQRGLAISGKARILAGVVLGGLIIGGWLWLGRRPKEAQQANPAVTTRSQTISPETGGMSAEKSGNPPGMRAGSDKPLPQPAKEASYASNTQASNRASETDAFVPTATSTSWNGRWFMQFDEKSKTRACQVASEPQLKGSAVFECSETDGSPPVFLVRLGPVDDRTELDRVRAHYLRTNDWPILLRHEDCSKPVRRVDCRVPTP